MGLYDAAFTELQNGSIMSAVSSTYMVAWGVYFWPIMLFVTLVIVAVRTNSAALVGIIGVVGHVAMAAFLPIETQIIFYVSMVFNLAVVLYAFFGSPKHD